MAGLMKFVGCGAGFLLLTACSVFSPVPAVGTSTYVLNTVPQVSVRKAHKTSVFVAAPVTDSIYNTTDMAYMSHPYQISYFAKNNWAATPSQMLQPLMVQALQNTRHFSNVTSSVGVGSPVYNLNTEIMDFKQEFFGPRSEFHLTVRAQLVLVATNTVVAAKEFKIIEPATQNNPLGGVYAANQAEAKFLRELTQFCLKHTR